MNRTDKLTDSQRTEFTQRIAALEAAQPGFSAAWSALEDLLCSHGGHGVALHDQRLGMLERLLIDGKMSKPAHVRVAHMARNSSHANTARLWAESQGVEKIWTGYAYSGGGLWRDHSWADDGYGVIETTEARLSYFGMGLAFNDSVKMLVATCDVETIDPAVFQTPFWAEVMAALTELAAAG